MDGRGRRSRRGRAAYSSCNPPNLQPWSFINSFCNFVILSSLLGVIYLMLEYHCNKCNTNCDLSNINKSIADIAKNVACMKHRYHDLEMKICRFSHELPKLEGQVELIEALTSAIEKDSGWDPRKDIPLPNVDVFLNNSPCGTEKNGTCNCLKSSPKAFA